MIPDGLVYIDIWVDESLGRCFQLMETDEPGLFEQWINGLASEIANRPVVLLLETDVIGSSGCIRSHGALGQWEQDLRYEIDTFAKLPHAVVYVEAGYSDANSPKYTASVPMKFPTRTPSGPSWKVTTSRTVAPTVMITLARLATT